MWQTLEALFYTALILLFLSSFLPKRITTKIANAPAYAVPFTAALLRWLAAHMAILVSYAWRFCVELGRLVEPLAYRLVTGRDPTARTGAMFPTVGEGLDRGGVLHTPHPLHPPTTLPPPVPLESPLPAAENADLHGGDLPPTEGEIPPATADEVQALGRALRHNLTSADKTKSGAIKAGWGLSRSGTDPRYRRASQLYDLATKEPAPPPRAEPVIRRRKA